MELNKRKCTENRGKLPNGEISALSVSSPRKLGLQTALGAVLQAADSARLGGTLEKRTRSSWPVSQGKSPLLNCSCWTLI